MIALLGCRSTNTEIASTFIESFDHQLAKRFVNSHELALVIRYGACTLQAPSNSGEARIHSYFGLNRTRAMA